MGKRELIALLNLSSWCLVMVERLFLAVPWGCLQFVIVVFLDHTHLLFLILELSRSFPIGLQCVIVAFLGHTNWLVDKILLNIDKIDSAFLRISHSTLFETLTL